MSDSKPQALRQVMQSAYYPQQAIEITINPSAMQQNPLAAPQSLPQRAYNPFGFADDFLSRETRLNPQSPVLAHGIVQGGDAWLFAAASPRAARLTQLLLGERLTIHKQEEDFFLVQNRSDAHCGWIHKSFVYSLKMQAPEAKWRMRCNAAVTVEPDFKSPLRLCVPMGALINISAVHDDYVQVENIGWVHKAQVESVDECHDVVEIARSLLGCAYLWGGRNPASGLDCSALTQICYKFAGRSLPRDSDLQRNYLYRNHQRVVAAQMQAGDLIFIPGHTMIYAGNNRVIHATAAFMRVVEEDFAVLIKRLRSKQAGKLAITAFHWMQ